MVSLLIDFRCIIKLYSLHCKSFYHCIRFLEMFFYSPF